MKTNLNLIKNLINDLLYLLVKFIFTCERIERQIHLVFIVICPSFIKTWKISHSRVTRVTIKNRIT